MQNIVDKQFLIVRGTGGRELLANTLMTRGAKISYLEVYQRQIPSLADVEIDQAKQADAIIVTSNTGLDNLCQLVAVESIKDKSLIVVSDRIRQHAVELGFQHIYVTDDVSDAAMVQQVIEVGQNNGK
jgi:uroporphyrinogen-III synthase